MSKTRARQLVVSTLTLLLLLATTAGYSAPLDHPHDSHQVIIKFKANAPQSQKDAILADLGAVQLKHFKRIKTDHKQLTRVSADEAIGRYKNHPAIEFIEPNYPISVIIHITPDIRVSDRIYVSISIFTYNYQWNW